MKLLLDENLPKKLKNDLLIHEVFTVRDMGWSGKKNGQLLQLMLDTDFDALVTFDKNLRFQQNFEKYPICVIVLNAEDNSYLTLKHLSPKILTVLEQPLRPGPVEVR